MFAIEAIGQNGTFQDSKDDEPFFGFDVEDIVLSSPSLVVICAREITVLTYASPSILCSLTV